MLGIPDINGSVLLWCIQVNEHNQILTLNRLL